VSRRELHPEEAILDAAPAVVAERGIRAATVAAVAAASGAPTGSIYHRFGSVQEVLARLWVRAVRRSQEATLPLLAEEDPAQGLVAAALATYDFCFRRPDDARLLALFSRSDFLAAGLPGELNEELVRLNDAAMDAMRHLSRRLFGRAARRELDLVLACAVDLPYGLARRYLETGARPPSSRRAAVATGVRAMLTEGEG
jgi:AcrR family transcriptional regulator